MPETQTEPQPTALPFHDPPAFKAAVRMLRTSGLSAKALDDLLAGQGAPLAARLEARILYENPGTPHALVALLHSATRSNLAAAVPDACRRHRIHPLSIVARETSRPLGLGREFRLPEHQIRSMPGKRKEDLNVGLWAPRPNTLGAPLLPGLVLNKVILAEQSGLTRLPEGLRVADWLTLDRLPRLVELDGVLDGFHGTLQVRACESLAELPGGLHLSQFLADGLPWSRFPHQPLNAGRVELHHMVNLSELGPEIHARLIDIASCPRLTSISPLPHLVPAPEASARAMKEGNPHLRHGVTIRDSHGLAALPPGFRVPGTLAIRDCESFCGLPTDLEAWTLDLQHLPALRRLPEGLHIRGHLLLNGLSHLKALPDGLSVDGNLVLRNMPRAFEPPANLQVGGTVHLHPVMATGAWRAFRLTHGPLGAGR